LITTLPHVGAQRTAAPPGDAHPADAHPADAHPAAAGLNVEIGTAQWAFDRGQPAGFGTDTLPGSEVLYIPLRAPTKARGVLAVKAHNRRMLRIPEQRRLLDTFAALIAIALERVHYVGVAQDALLKMESERLRNSLLAALSHDLRTPLTVLVGLAESLALTTPKLSSEQLETAQAIQDEAHRMSTLVSNLLDMARIESGEVTLNLQWQPLEEVAGSALEAARSMLQRHAVVVQLPRDLPLVKFDAVLIERVLVNLFENVSKYTPPGSTVTLSAQVIADRLSVSISDNGPGLPAGREEAVFQKFTRGERESATPGVGLGLSICRAIIESHQGKITSAQRPGGGAIFTFHAALRCSAAGYRWLSRSPLRFSLKMNRKSAASFARRWRRKVGASTRQRPCGRDRPMRVRAGRTLIILDLGLPDGDGVEFLHDLRGWSKVPVIVLSARVSEQDKVAALDAGADDYLTKPFGVGELLARVRATSRRHLEAGADAGAVFTFGDVKIDLSLRTAHKANTAIHLTPIEYRLLSLLIANAGKVLTHRQILREVWGPSHSEDGHYVRVYMGHLRQKLEDDPAQPKHILTETAVGYRLVQSARS